MISVEAELNIHIKDKIKYHEKLLAQTEAIEDYEGCIPHRDEIKRLKTLLT